MIKAAPKVPNPTIQHFFSSSETKSFDFAIRIVRLNKYLRDKKKEFVLSKQLLKSGTSIGANVAEAECGQSKADFYAKMYIALKEANETYYWLRLLHESKYLTHKQFESIEEDTKAIIAILTSICKTIKMEKEKQS